MPGKRQLTGKALLQNVTFQVTPGRLTYIMGPSGAGKSTLLNLLARRLKRGSLGGEVRYNGKDEKEGGDGWSKEDESFRSRYQRGGEMQ